MKLSVNGAETFVATGGRPFDPSLPAVVFLHGAGFDHSTWALHSRWFAHHGYSRAGARSARPRPLGRPAAADASPRWRTGPPRCSTRPARRRRKLIGHSMGSLIALETAARHPDKVCGAEPDRHRRDDDGRPRSAEGGGGQRPGRHRHGVDLGPRLQGRTRRQPGAGPVDAWRRAARAAAVRGPACCSTISPPATPIRTRWRPPRSVKVPDHAHSRRARHDDAGEGRQGAGRGDRRMRAPSCCRAPAT